jgi:Tol biopolymer transport system component
LRSLRPYLLVVCAVSTCALVPSAASAIGESAQTTLISVTSSGVQGKNASTQGLVSADGRIVVFESASSLAAGGRNAVFLRDRERGVTRLISVDGHGRSVNDVASLAAVSEKGDYVLWNTKATSLGPGDGKQHVYLRDRRLRTTKPIRSAARSDGERGIDVSGGGRFVTFAYDSGTTTTVMLEDRLRHTFRMVGRGGETSASLLTGGLMTDRAGEVFFARGTHLYVWRRSGAPTDRVPVPAGADLVDAADISKDGRYLLFDVYRFDPAGNVFSEVYVRDRVAEVTTRVSVGPPEFSTSAVGNSISDDGRYVAFDSSSAAFVSGDTNAENDVFVRDMTAGQTIRVSVAADGSQLPTFSAVADGPALSADGRVVAFSTPGAAVARDTNRVFDVFVRAPLHTP